MEEEHKENRFCSTSIAKKNLRSVWFDILKRRIQVKHKCQSIRMTLRGIFSAVLALWFHLFSNLLTSLLVSAHIWRKCVKWDECCWLRSKACQVQHLVSLSQSGWPAALGRTGAWLQHKVASFRLGSLWRFGVWSLEKARFFLWGTSVGCNAIECTCSSI